MRNLSDYLFVASWHTSELVVKEGKRYLVLSDFGDLRSGSIVTFVGFDDVDNHYGIAVFKSDAGEIFEVGGDFSGRGNWMFVGVENALVEIR